MQPADWQGVAFNQATASENRIHSDEVARRYGFRGGLVPGVTVHAYLVHPGLARWGRSWLECGAASVVLSSPLYDGAAFRVRAKTDGEDAYQGEVLDGQGGVCASGRVALPASPPQAPTRRGDPPAPPRDARPEANRAALETLRDSGLGALHLEWNGRAELDRYTRDLDAMPDLVRPDRDGFANPAFALGLANWVLSANVRLGPWIHVQSQVQNFAAIPPGSRLLTEARVEGLFERRGHEFVDLDVGVYLEAGDPVLHATHRAIYRLRPPQAEQ